RAASRESPLARGAPAAALPADIRSVIEQMPTSIRELVVHAIPKLIDYQDVGYARRYLELLEPFVPREGATAARLGMGQAVARYLALWMTYEEIGRAHV